MAERIGPGGTVGILGGGQLGRMLAQAAARLGLRTLVYDPDPGAPAAQVASRHFARAYDDAPALRDFAALADVVTYEFENIPVAALDLIEALAPIRPARRALAVSQDRVAEKDFLSSLGIATAPYRAVASAEEVQAALGTIGAPAVLKTRRLGYDGKGQARLSAPSEGAGAWAAIGGQPAILEGFVPFEREISVIAARGLDGSVACFDPGENVHEGGILRTSTVPANTSAAMAQDAVLVAGRILNALDYVGVLGVEFFVADRLLVNEIAPRVHNSGHWTSAACLIDQFEQHIRAICGWPLGDGARHSDAVMTNIIGEDVAGYADIADAQVTLYGKAEARPGRKMGHITQVTPRT